MTRYKNMQMMFDIWFNYKILLESPIVKTFEIIQDRSTFQLLTEYLGSLSVYFINIKIYTMANL